MNDIINELNAKKVLDEDTWDVVTSMIFGPIRSVLNIWLNGTTTERVGKWKKSLKNLKTVI